MLQNKHLLPTVTKASQPVAGNYSCSTVSDDRLAQIENDLKYDVEALCVHIP